jgi:hypothetical protein
MTTHERISAIADCQNQVAINRKLIVDNDTRVKELWHQIKDFTNTSHGEAERVGGIIRGLRKENELIEKQIALLNHKLNNLNK